MFGILLVLHVLLTTAGYVGLIATNAHLLAISSAQSPDDVLKGLRLWRRFARVFGPLLGVGVLLGFGLVGIAHVPLGARWALRHLRLDRYSDCLNGDDHDSVAKPRQSGASER